MEMFHCVRCGHNWHNRKIEKPRCCAKCKVRYWDRPARVPKPPSEPKAIGRPALYPVQTLEVGQSLILAWHTLPSGYRDEARNKGMNVAIQSYAKRTNKRILREGTPRGLRVTRLL